MHLTTLLYQESDLLNVGFVVQNARKQCTVLLQWGLIGSTFQHFADTFFLVNTVQLLDPIKSPL